MLENKVNKVTKNLKYKGKNKQTKKTQKLLKKHCIFFDIYIIQYIAINTVPVYDM